MLRRNSLSFFALAIALAAIGCVEAEFEDRHPESKEIIDDDELERLQEGGFEVHKGSDFPDVDGTYPADELEVIFADNEDRIGTDNYVGYYYNTETEPDGTAELQLRGGDAEAEGYGRGIYLR